MVILPLLLVAGSVALTIIFFLAGLPFFFLFLLIPFISLRGRSKEVLRCPVCGFESIGAVRYCPYDGNELT
jgi:hypothetical protein